MPRHVKKVLLWHIEKSKHIRAFEGKSSGNTEVEIQISWCFFRWFLSILAHHTDCTSAKRWKKCFRTMQGFLQHNLVPGLHECAQSIVYAHAARTVFRPERGGSKRNNMCIHCKETLDRSESVTVKD